MGRITIYIPQDTERSFEIRNPETAKRLVTMLDEVAERDKDEEDDILGIWTPPRTAPANNAA